ncbi:MAG: hypothetical protein Q9209_003145 [Squamulea sp. 1 TL-2023]
MPTNETLAEILSKLHNICTFPALERLDREDCSICSNEYQTDGPEKPIQLGCGHVFGMTCILTWTLDKVGAGNIPDCPVCRRPCLNPVENNDMAEALALIPDERADAIQRLTSWIPHRDESPYVADAAWVRQAERLWDIFCDDIITTLNEPDDFLGIIHGVDNFLHEARDALSILSYGSVYNFYEAREAYKARDARNDPRLDDHVLILQEGQRRYESLIYHLDTASARGIDVQNWRISQAFRQDSPQPLQGHRRRLEQIRDAWLQRAQQSNPIPATTGIASIGDDVPPDDEDSLFGPVPHDEGIYVSSPASSL